MATAAMKESDNVTNPANSTERAVLRLDSADSPMRVLASQTYGKLPMRFEANQGQTDSRVKFLSRGSGYTLFLTANEAVLKLRKEAGNQEKSDNYSISSSLPRPSSLTSLRMRLVNSNPEPRVSGVDEMPGRSHYLIGNDPRQWRTGVRNFGRVRYESVYPGIDLIYYGNQQRLEYDFVVMPGARPDGIRLAFTGARSMELDEQGALVLRVEGSEVRLLKPQAYQVVDGERRVVAAQYRLDGQRSEVGLVVDHYEPGQINLLIPPSNAPFDAITGEILVKVKRQGRVVAVGLMQVEKVAPSLFAADASGQGPAAAVALRVKADGAQVYEPVASYDAAQQRFTAVPPDLSDPREQVFLILFGTGIRYLNDPAAVRVKVGGEDAEVAYAGAQGSLFGLDQVNVRLPRSLAGRGEVSIVLAVDGKTANTVRVSIR